MQSGRGGMGSHKHGTSGRAGPAPGAKQDRAREANRLAEEERRKRPRPRMHGSVREALEKGGGGR